MDGGKGLRVDRLWLAALLAAMCTVPASARPGPGEPGAPAVAQHGDWSTACDNAGQCTAVSVSRAYVRRMELSEPGDYARPKLWVRREAGPDAPPRVFVDTTVWGEAVDAGELTLHVVLECPDVCPEERTGRAYRLTWIEPGRYELASGQVAAFFAQSTQSSQAATRTAAGDMHGIITTAGLVAAMRWIDEAQGRTGTVTAIYARGQGLASSVPPPRPRPVVQVTRGEELPETTFESQPAVMQAWLRHCDGTETDRLVPVQQFRLATGQHLWSAGCGSTPFEDERIWLIESPSGELEAFALPRPDTGARASQPILSNSRFDPEAGQLISYSTGMCGWQRRWAWSGSEFAMIDAIAMPACSDILPHNWLQTYRAIPE